MFDKLVESTKQKQGRRARRLFLTTGAIYIAALTALGVATIVGINPALAEESYMILSHTPPPPPQGYAQAPAARGKPNPSTPSLTPPNKIVDVLPPDYKLNSDPAPRLIVAGAPRLPEEGYGLGAPRITEAPPPPPPPAVKPTPTPTPAPVAPVVRLTSSLTQGRVLQRAQPAYPAIAKAARVQGQVQIQISISETGAVTDAILLSGHPLLRDAALQAARQWTFIPTELNGQKVRAIGLLTFNFKLY